MRLTLLPVLAGSALFLGAGYAATVVAPTVGSAGVDPDAPRYSIAAVKGQDVYAGQGCVYCHTQQVRDAYTDSLLDETATTRPETLGDQPGALGDVRHGPDLTCAGDRVPGVVAEDDDEQELVERMVAYLRDPSAVRPGTTMPSYDHLSDDDLRRLAAYLVAQTCTDGEHS